VLGSTAACLVAQQFRRLISGDRYFFTHGQDTGAGFSQAQVPIFLNLILIIFQIRFN
jgi:hypothetical protein